MKGPGAGRQKAEYWEDARKLAASLGLMPAQAALTYLKKNIIANQLRLTRGEFYTITKELGTYKAYIFLLLLQMLDNRVLICDGQLRT